MSGSEHGSGSDYDSDSDSPFVYVLSCDSSVEEEIEPYDSPCVSPWIQSLCDEGMMARVLSLSALTCCKNRCLSDKEDLLRKFVYSMNEMGKEARKTAFLTALAISAHADLSGRHRGDGQRTLATPTSCHSAVSSARSQVADGRAFVQPHKNTSNTHHTSIDDELLVRWLRDVGRGVGEPQPVRFRRQRTSNDVTVRYTTRQDITFLPAFLTWRDLYNQYCNFIADKHPETAKPSFSSFYKILRKRCKDIQIASPRSNVCDVCAIYRNNSSRTPTALETENQAVHAMDARAMSKQYAKDSGLVGSKNFVSTIDFAQNIAMPHAASTPSAWYFMSLIGVSVFGVYSENTHQQINYFYSENVAGKGSNEVVSMLHNFALRSKIYGAGPGTAAWTIYADNCGGQNKNNDLIRYLRFLVDSKRLRTASLYFLVKGHTKNHCDRGFGQIKRAYAKKDLYTMDQIGEAVNTSSTTNAAVCLENTNGVFFDWKATLQPVYRDLHKIQSYQLFNFTSAVPGQVSCRKRPTAAPVTQTILKSTTQDWEGLWNSLQPLPKCGPNPEKVTDLHKKILPYIPEEFRSCDLNRGPTEDERAVTQEKKRRRRKTTPTLVERAKARRQQEADEMEDTS